MRTVGFYNHANLGDLHISRNLVKTLMQRATGVDHWLYAHRHSPRILQDIVGLEQVALAKQEPYKAACTDENGVLWFNTWYAASPVWCAGNGMGCTLNTLHELFRDHARALGCSLDEPVENFIPTIDFSKYSVEGARAFLDLARKEYRKTVLVCNGETMSGQTRMPPGVFNQLVCDVIKVHPDILFLLSNVPVAQSQPQPLFRGENVMIPNMFYTTDIIALDDACDLPENSYVSTKCGIIIGRGSGAYSFAYLADNFMDANKTMVCFTDDERTARWVIPYGVTKARILWSNDYSMENMKKLVEEAIK